MRRAANLDGNHAEIVAALRKCGVRVHSLARLGQGVPDLLCSVRGEIHLLEIKDGTLKPSRQALTPVEKSWHAQWAGPRVHIVRSIDEALAAVGVKR